MRVAKLAGPLIVSRLGEMVSSFLYLAFVGHFLPGALGGASFAWAFISLSTVIGIGFFSALMIEVASTAKVDGEKSLMFFHTGLKLACFLGGLVTASVLLYLALHNDPSENINSPNGATLFLMSLSLPALYLQIVIFNYLNALNRPKFELIFVWLFNATLVAMGLAYIIFKPDISIIVFSIAYSSLRWLFVLTALVLLNRASKKTNYHRLVKNTSSLTQYKSFLLKGAPLALCFGGESFLYFAFSIIAKNIGNLEIAAYQASLHFLSIIYMISIGVGNATAILTAQPYKEQKLATVKARCFEGLAFGAVLLAPCLMGCLYFPDLIANLYSSDAETRKLISENIKIAVPFLLFEYIYVVIRMILRSLGDSWVPTALTLLTLNLLGLSTTWLFFNIYHPAVKYIFWSLTLCTFVLMIFLAWRLVSVFGAHQKPNPNAGPLCKR